jgi:hydrogenase maturation protein HypF
VECEKTDGILQLNGVKLLVDMQKLKGQYDKKILAYLFHHAVAKAMIDSAECVCAEHDVKQVALSGGTFLNRILLGEVSQGLREKGVQVYINEKVPCGDGGIALGQMYLATYQTAE